VSEQRQSWEDKGRAQRYARQTSITTRLACTSLARKVVGDVAPLEQGAIIVELGSGPGHLAIELSKLCPQASVIALDPSEEMLRIARTKAQAAGASNLEATAGAAESIPLEAGSVDLVISQSSFHEWAGQQQGIAEAYRVLKPGGTLVIKDYDRGWLSAWKRRLLSLLHPLHMFRFTCDEVAAMLREAGFEPVEAQRGELQYLLQARKP